MNTIKFSHRQIAIGFRNARWKQQSLVVTRLSVRFAACSLRYSSLVPLINQYLNNPTSEIFDKIELHFRLNPSSPLDEYERDELQRTLLSLPNLIGEKPDGK